MFNQKQTIGRLGEEIAKKYLKRKGYKILEQHYCLRGGEIDLVVQKKERLIFVEVKTRTSDKFGRPEESISYFKQRNLNRAIHNYLFKRRLKNENYQFDVIAIILNREKRKATVRHFENVILEH